MRGKVRTFPREKKDRLFAQAGFALGFVVIVGLFVVISLNVFAMAKLELEFDVEKALNNIIFAIQDDNKNMDVVMAENNVLGVGVYSSYGNRLYSKGSAYSRLPISTFDLASNESNMHNSITKYDSERHLYEYIRLSKQAVIPTSKNLLLPINGEIIEFQNIIYIAYDAEDYANQMRNLQMIAFASSIVILTCYYLIVKFYRQNVQYKEMLRKQENLVSLGQAARTLAHEIKNPLAAITIQLALLKRTVPSENLEDLGIIEKETKRVIALTDRVSDFLKNPQGHPEKVDVMEVISDLIPLFPYPVEFIDKMDTAYVRFDRDRIRSIFENLIKNAIEATAEGKEPEVEVEVAKARKSRYYSIYVRDRGVGIDGVDMKKIYDPFFTTKIHGSGIGLAISRKFVEASGGKMSLKPRDGGGTVVEVQIPVYGEEEKGHEGSDM